MTSTCTCPSSRPRANARSPGRYEPSLSAPKSKGPREGAGDDLRNWREAGHDIYWKVYGRNKCSLVLDLKSDEGLEHLRQLVKRSQIFIENFVPGGLERMGLAPEQRFCRCKPRIDNGAWPHCISNWQTRPCAA